MEFGARRGRYSIGIGDASHMDRGAKTFSCSRPSILLGARRFLSRREESRWLLELEDRLIDRERVTDAHEHLGHLRFALGAEHVFHFHRLDHR